MARITEDNYKIVFEDKILDPVHGFIDITLVEKELIALPIFKRLLSIKQLSLTNWIYPGAEHTRYSHSLGVMHIVDLMAKNLKRIDDGSYRFNDGQRQILRLAGLLHDIGHYPLSHVTEQIYLEDLSDESDDLIQLNHSQVKSAIQDIKCTDDDIWDYMSDRSSVKFHHETIGKSIIDSDEQIKSIINKHCPFINIEDIQNIIVGCTGDNDHLSAMVQLMHSELDADGIDYLMRDTTFAGTQFGGFELNLLLRNLVVCKHNGVEIVGIKSKGISCADQYLLGKHFSYLQVIYNSHVSILEDMVKKVSKVFVKYKDSSYLSEKDLINAIKLHNDENHDEFLKFTDIKFWAQLNQIEAEKAKGFIDDLGVKIIKKLQKFQEFEKENELVLTSTNPTETYNEITKSVAYQNLVMDQNDKLYIFITRRFTKEIPIDEYSRRLAVKEERETIEDSEFLLQKKTRLQEGIAIIEKDKDPILLVDDNRSLTSHMWNSVLYVLREYKVA